MVLHAGGLAYMGRSYPLTTYIEGAPELFENDFYRGEDQHIVADRY